MAKSRKQVTAKKQPRDVMEGLQPLNLDVAGIDVGSAEHYVAVPADRDVRPIQKFHSFTADLHRLARWLEGCGIKVVAMQATGVYWIGLFQILESHGFVVKVVNARYTRTMAGHKSDVPECDWIRKLETFGLLNNSFLPPHEIRALRSYLRQRETLVSEAGTYIQRMQKALTEMNIQLANVLSDLSGVSGMAILRAILKGERDGYQLADLCDRHVKATPQEIAQSLEGDWRPELLFVLQQTVALYDQSLKLITECDQRIQQHLDTMASKVDPAVTPPPEPRKPPVKRRAKHEPPLQLRTELYRIAGVDLTRIDGIQLATAQVVLSEIGVDMSRWPDEYHLGSWLGLSPNNQVSGGKVLRKGTKKVLNRASHALRLAAQNLFRSQSALGSKYRRLRMKLGAPKAITAMAYHLARLIYRMLKNGTDYTDKGMNYYETKYRESELKRLAKLAGRHGMQLVPIAGVPV
jgi:transposase